MKWVWIALAVFAALVLGIACVGALLPVGHVASRRARYTQTPHAIYRAIVDVHAAPNWRTGLTSVELLPDRDGKRCYREQLATGPMELVVEVDELDRRVVTRIADPTLPFGGTWTFEIEPRGDSTELSITENGEIHNVFFRALARLVFGYESTIDAYLTALGANFGETIAIEPGR